MNQTIPETYTNSYDLKSNRVITKKDFIILCNLLTTEFNNYYSTNIYKLQHEPITEGGIVFKNFTGDVYKTMRIYIAQFGKYGWINPGVMDENHHAMMDEVHRRGWFTPAQRAGEWKDNNDILCDKGVKMSTYLKSFRGAPVWTLHELKIFEKCFTALRAG